MVIELATGVDTFDAICAKFGYNEHDIAALRDDPGLARRVADTEKTLREEGFTFRARCAYAAEMMVEDLLRSAMQTTTGVPAKIDAVKFFATAADLLPKANAPSQQPGGRFSLVINLGEDSVHIGSQPAPTPPLEVIDVAPVDALPPAAPSRKRSKSRAKNADLLLPEGFVCE
jgi:hypothetical protein